MVDGPEPTAQPPLRSRGRAAPRRFVIALLSATLLAACGGGAGGGTSSSPSSTPTPPPPPPNQSPVLVHATTNQHLITNHPFAYDVSQGGTAVTDPNGDTLTYQFLVEGTTPTWPKGLSATGPVISGTPSEAGSWVVEAQVDDGHGGNSVIFQFGLEVAANAPPVAIHGNAPALVSPGASVDIDATQGGMTFQDGDGDPMTYAVTLRGGPHGLAVSGTHITGTFDAIGAVEATITASDGFGGIGSDTFLIAAPTAVPVASPNLPATPFSYRDEELPLPFVLSMSSQSVTPLWDRQPPDNRTTDAGATLGRVLFYDKRLSITNTHSCAFCHQQSLGFASPNRFDVGVLGTTLKRSAMALANVRYSINSAWFSDMRVTGDLRNLVFVPIDNHDELGMALFPVESKLQSAAFYPSLFNAAFGTPDITRDRIAAALAQFVQSLISYRSKWDQANNPLTNGPGDPTAVLTAQELQGMQFYTTRCSICHEAVANTNVWPANNGLDVVPTDPGVNNPAFQRSGALGVFRAASLRNIAVSAPYMHDGRFATLREVIDHYDSGIQDSPNLDALLRDLTGAPWRLNMTEADKLALEAFLNTLTDSAFLSDPKFSDPFAP